MRKTCTNIYQTCPEDVRIDSKINENRHQEGPKIDENRWLDGSWSSVRRLWRAWARIFWKVAGKMREVRPRWQQVAPKMGHDGVKMAILVSTLAALGPSWA